MPDIFDDLWDWVSGGQVTRAREERGKLDALHSRLEKLVKNYKYWHLQGTILSKALYQITIMAFNEVCKLNDIIEHLTIKQRKINEHTLRDKNYILKDIEQSISALKSISGSGGRLLDTKQFVQNTLDGNLAILEKMPNSTGLASAGVYTVISGLEHYTSLNSKIQDFKAGQYAVLKRIDKLEGKLYRLKAELHRADEIGVGLGKGITAFRHCYEDFRKDLFPNGEESKLKRKARAASGGAYFEDDEQRKVRLLLDAGGFLLKMIEAKP